MAVGRSAIAANRVYMSELSLARVLIEIQMMYLGMPDRRGLLTFWAELQCANGQGLDRPAFEAGLQRVVSENANEVPRRWTSESRTPAAAVCRIRRATASGARPLAPQTLLCEPRTPVLRRDGCDSVFSGVSRQ